MTKMKWQRKEIFRFSKFLPAVHVLDNANICLGELYYPFDPLHAKLRTWVKVVRGALARAK